VDDAAEYVAAADLTDAWLVVERQWGRELMAPVRASLVVVAHVVAEHRFELTCSWRLGGRTRQSCVGVEGEKAVVLLFSVMPTQVDVVVAESSVVMVVPDGFVGDDSDGVLVIQIVVATARVAPAVSGQPSP